MSAPLPSSSSPAAHEVAAGHRGAVGLLLNVGHGVDHLMLLIFATAVGAIAHDFGFARWEDLMPFTTGAFVLFGLGSLPAGRLGDHWGRRSMMLVFFFGIGASALLVAATQSAWQLAIALTVMGAFASIYHPVGIPMLLQVAERPGQVIGVNGLAGNLGIAVAALSTGWLVKYIGWRAAFVVPGLVAIGCGAWFARVAPHELAPPVQRKPRQVDLPRSLAVRVFAVVAFTSTCGAVLFNFTTNGNAELLRERLASITRDPATIGSWLAAIYAIGALSQLVVGRWIDRFELKRLFLLLVVLQVPLFALAAFADGWALLAAVFGIMVLVFGAIPFTDAIVVRYFDDRMRSRVAGVRFAIAFGISSLAVWALGPIVRASGFAFLLGLSAFIAACAAATILALPRSMSTAIARPE